LFCSLFFLLFCSSDNRAQKFGMVNRMGAHVRACVCVRAPARTRELDCSQMKTLVIALQKSLPWHKTSCGHSRPLRASSRSTTSTFESDTYVVSSAVGHLVEIQAPEAFDVKRGKWSFANLPVIPPALRPQAR
jgi:DNA topoisomerase-3